MSGGSDRHPGGTPGRFHLTLYSASRPVMRGWWGSESVARSKFLRWVGSGVADAQVLLVDEETGARLDEWPAIVSGGS
jgi:hypothetical protein